MNVLASVAESCIPDVRSTRVSVSKPLLPRFPNLSLLLFVNMKSITDIFSVSIPCSQEATNPDLGKLFCRHISLSQN